MQAGGDSLVTQDHMPRSTQASKKVASQPASHPGLPPSTALQCGTAVRCMLGMVAALTTNACVAATGLEPASKHEGGKRAGGHQPRAQKKPCVAHQLAVQYGDIGWSELPGELKEIISPQSVDPEHFGQAEHSVQAHCYQLVEQLSACLQPSFMPDTYQPDVPALLPPLTGSCMLLRKEF